MYSVNKKVNASLHHCTLNTKVGHFRDVLLSQSLSTVLRTKPNMTQQINLPKY